MSLVSLILAFAPGVAARLKPDKSQRERELEAHAERLEFALDHWRDAATALQAENERLELERQNWRNLANQLMSDSDREARRHAAAQLQQNELFAQQHQNWQLAQQSQLAQHNHQLGQQAQNQQAQQQALGQWHDCTCVPARAAAFGVHIPEPFPGA